jgi:hypothetical protein
MSNASAVFVATFGDGREVVITRMTVHAPKDRLSLTRGVRLARAAYQSRTKQPPPAIVSAHYERDGEVIESYEQRELLDAVP